ncbi:MAG: hypothetical protein CML66_10350 [Rhodobacteraceae bacterium]|nr:hypothetical protein [Paracoccaceae bacterium]
MVAANGRGKSTLLACLSGDLDPTAGEITRARGLRVGHVRQNVPYDLQHRPLGDLSGGWQRTAMLAAVRVTMPDLLLLDEPTNHLDIEGQEATDRTGRVVPAGQP